MDDTAALDRLEKLKRGDPALLSAADFNWMVAWADRCRKLPPRYGVGNPTPFPHPWQVSVSRYDEIAPGWRINVRPGTINDLLPSILYLRKADPRCWELPESYVESPLKGAPGWDAKWVERDLLDDPASPPWLLLASPPAAATQDAGWTKLPRTQWPPYFSAQDALEKAELWQAHVVTSAGTARPSLLHGLRPPTTRRFRLWTLPALPGASFALSGAWLELATLFLVRTESDQPENDVLFVRQTEFWPAWSVIVRPGIDLSPLGSGVGFVDALVDLVQGSVDQIFDAAASVETWTV